MSHHRHHHHDEDHEHGHRHDRHHELHRTGCGTRWQRRLRRNGDDVTALEELQRDLEQAAADVAARIEALRAKSSS